jgi:hypothetical protein
MACLGGGHSKAILTSPPNKVLLKELMIVMRREKGPGHEQKTGKTGKKWRG